MKKLLEQLDTMATGFTNDDVQQEVNNIACKLHTLLAKCANLKKREKIILTAAAQNIVKLAK